MHEPRWRESIRKRLTSSDNLFDNVNSNIEILINLFDNVNSNVKILMIMMQNGSGGSVIIGDDSDQILL